MGVASARVLGIVCCAVLGWASRPESATLEAPDAQRRFRFEAHALLLPTHSSRVREVHGALQRIAPWVSAFGAAAAIGDIDGDDHANDACAVDPRDDSVRLFIGLDRLVRTPGAAVRRQKVDLPTTAPRSPPWAPMGCLMNDLDGDGRPDLVLYFWGRAPLALLGRGATPQGDLAFEAREIVADDVVWYSSAALLADVDGDGRLDLIFGNYFCDGGRVLDPRATGGVCAKGPGMHASWSRSRNGGGLRILRQTGTAALAFDDVSAAVPVEAGGGWTLAVAASDLNGDLLPDLYLANDFGSDRLLINCSKPEASFGHPGRDLGCSTPVNGISFRLLEGRRDALTPRSKTLGRDSFKGMGAEFADMDGNGAPLLLVSNITAPWGLQESQLAFGPTGEALNAALVRAGAAPLVDVSRRLGFLRSGWAWDLKAADFDNDGRPELVQSLGYVQGSSSGVLGAGSNCWPQLQEMATANDNLVSDPRWWFRMHRAAGGPTCDLSGIGPKLAFFTAGKNGRLEDIARYLPFESAGTGVSRGLAVGDLDGDGAVDLLEATQDGLTLFVNRMASPSFLAFDLRVVMPSQGGATPPSRPAIGAELLVFAGGRVIHRAEVDGGNGHSGKRSPVLHLGLAAAYRRTDLTARLRWRDPNFGVPQCAWLSDLRVGETQRIQLTSPPDAKQGLVPC